MRTQLRNRVRALAHNVLQRHRLSSAPVDLHALTQQEGILLTKADLGQDVAGLLTWTRSGQPMVCLNSQHDDPRDPQRLSKRQRFTLAHELGHYFLGHRGAVFYDEQTTVIFRREGVSNPQEAAANAFAAELLMPEPLLRAEVEDLLDSRGWLDDDAVGDLARDYDVSVQAMTIRLSRLGYISEF